MATLYNKHACENEILKWLMQNIWMLGLAERDVRKLELIFEVDSLVTVNAEFFPTKDEIDKTIKIINGKYKFRLESFEETTNGRGE